MTINKVEKKEYIALGLIGCLLGILSFLLIYGVNVLIFTHDGWILSNELDIQQHYIGWCHYRKAPWTFPIGLIDSLSEPFSMSVVYTDSIPLFAVFFKLFRNILPVHFQYFGLFGILCYALQGALSAILIRLFSDKKLVCIIGSVFFIFSFPLLQRMFYHTALGAQWIILLALILWFSLDLKNIKKSTIIWGLMGFLCVSIHSYFVFMTGIILLLSLIENWINDKSVKQVIFPLISFCTVSFIVLYALGGFYGESNVSGYGFGTFNANMTAFINPLETGSLVIPAMTLYNYFEYEGFAYLGIGIFILLVFVAVYCLKKKNNIQLSIRRKLIIIGIIFSSFIAMFPNFDFAGIKLIHIPLPEFVKAVFGICRTNGRFMWIAYYLIVLSCIVLIAPLFDKQAVKILFIITVIIQLLDISKMVKNKNEIFRDIKSSSSQWSQFEKVRLFRNKDRFIFLYNDSDIMMDTAFYGYLNDLSQNIFYYARPIDDSVNSEIEEIKKQLSEGQIDETAIYVLRNEDITEELAKSFEKCNAVEYYFDGHVVYSK